MLSDINNYNENLLKAADSGAELNKMDMLVSAMWELMLEKGFTREQLNAKLDSIRERRVTLEPRKNMILCPACGKKVPENSTTPFEGKCMYCGTTTTIYPGDSIEFLNGETEAEAVIKDEDAPMQEIRPSFYDNSQDLF